ncbi:hypothetical protein BKA61DRAFT_656297 [Leptodontidium sp. MPI-SDFR-AT-0119]|nr:hypothetical protein BKA61DRAFT_656297 [Leptodontidium sp. MPI-SDFR-AT-0119]
MARGGVFSYVSFNLPALLRLAKQLRNVPCNCDSSKQPESGSWNWAIFISFEDGLEWVFLSPRKDNNIAPEIAAKLLESHVATLNFLKLNSPIPVPEVFDYRSNPIGIPYILMSKAPGFPLSRFAWDACPDGMVLSRKPRPVLGRTNKEKIMSQLGTISSQLLKLRFDKIGSLFEEDEEYRVKECLSPALIWHQRDSLGDDVARGPFQHENEYHESLLSAFLLHVKELPLEQHAFFAPIPKLGEFGSFLSHRSAKMIAAATLQPLAPPDESSNRFCLWHPDISLGNIFVDDDFNITCIIDWAFSSTVPISTLLMTPTFPHPRDDVDTTLVPIFRASLLRQICQSDIKLDQEFWDCTRRTWLFTRLVTLDGLQDYSYFTELHALVYKSEDEINVPGLFKGVQTEMQELAETLAEDGLLASEIKRGEEEYFSASNLDREAIARKLTVMANLSQGFVADKRLWRWIEKAMA